MNIDGWGMPVASPKVFVVNRHNQLIVQVVNEQVAKLVQDGNPGSTCKTYEEWMVIQEENIRKGKWNEQSHKNRP